MSALLWLLIGVLELVLTWLERAVMLAFVLSILAAGVSWIFFDD